MCKVVVVVCSSIRSSSSVRQISITSEAQRSFFLKVEWAEDLGSGFIVLLSDGVSAWSGEGKRSKHHTHQSSHYLLIIELSQPAVLLFPEICVV